MSENIHTKEEEILEVSESERSMIVLFGLLVVSVMTCHGMEMEMANAKALKTGLIFMGLVCLFENWSVISCRLW
jgi:hypothetical protein